MRRRRYFSRKFRRNRLFDYLRLYAVIICIILSIILFFSVMNRINYKNKQKPVTKTAKPISRNEAYKRGMDIINYVWEYNPLKNDISSSEVMLPSYLKGEKTLKTSGIPYCWGGFFSLDTGNFGGPRNFASAIRREYTAGNVNCVGGYKDYTAGLDCSGFVSAVFRLPEKCSTESLKDYFRKISINDIKPMDIFNCEKNHTFIFLRETDDKQGIITMESAMNGYEISGEKTIINYRTWESINAGVNRKSYMPMRYMGIVDNEVDLLKDKNEFNNSITKATISMAGVQNRGYIDYVGDVDFFRIDVQKAFKYSLNVISIPDDCSISLIDTIGNTSLKVDSKGIYPIASKEATYYIRVEGKDLKFSKDDYIFSINVESF